MSELLTTNDVVDRERVAYWREMICAVYVELDAEPKTQEPFSGSVSFSHWGETRLSIVESEAQLVRRRPGNSTNDCLLSLQLSGSAAITQFGRTAHLIPGDFTLYDAAAPYELDFPERFTQLVVQFPRSALISRNVHVESTVARPCAGRSGVGALVSSFAQTLAANDEDIADTHRTRFGSQALDFVATALAERTGRTTTTEALRASDRQRALDYVDQNLTDPSLSVGAIALAFGVSTRTIQKLFAGDEVRLAQRIRLARIERAKTILSDPLSDHVTIARIAYDLGFGSPSQFSRSFGRATGCTPRDYRMTSRH